MDILVILISQDFLPEIHSCLAFLKNDQASVQIKNTHPVTGNYGFYELPHGFSLWTAFKNAIGL